LEVILDHGEVSRHIARYVYLQLFNSNIVFVVWLNFGLSLDLRFQKLGKPWPRVEVNALWGLLAYFSASKGMADDKSFVRWHVISNLFSCGVFAGDYFDNKSKTLLPPSESQIAACEMEIGFLTKLLSKGIPDTLPPRDSVIVNLIRRSLFLQMDDYMGNEDSLGKCYPLLRDGKREKKMISRLWKATHPLFFADPNSLRSDASCSIFDIEFDTTDDGNRLNIKSLLVPCSAILQRCLELLPSWIKRVPEKKVRQNRFRKELKALEASLLDKANFPKPSPTPGQSEEHNRGNSFEAAFAVKDSLEVGAGVKHKSIFCREAAAHLYIVECLSKKASRTNDDACGPLIFPSESVKKVRKSNVLV
jgi:hypothetical protein